jgi:hypothetical protein
LDGARRKIEDRELRKLEREGVVLIVEASSQMRCSLTRFTFSFCRKRRQRKLKRGSRGLKQGWLC